MNNIYALYCILTSDNTGSSYILSNNKAEISLPIALIQNPKYLHEEARYYLRKCFNDENIQFNEECNADYLTLQNTFCIDYVSEHIKITDQDLVITYGGILLKNNLSDNYYWKRLQYDTEIKGFTSDKNLNLIIDNVIHKTLI